MGATGPVIRRWRRERDSNPRYPLRYTRFRGARLQPLGHLSAPHVQLLFYQGSCWLRLFPAPAGGGGRHRFYNLVQPGQIFRHSYSTTTFAVIFGWIEQ